MRHKRRRRVLDLRRLAAWKGWRLPEVPLEPETALEVLLGVVVIGSVLAVGSVHPATMVAMGALCTMAAALALWIRLRERTAFPLLWPAITLTALAAFTALQFVPLPLGWLSAIAPANADVWSRALLPLGEGAPHYAPVSLDPGASAIEVVRWLSYAAAFAAAAIVATWRGARWGVGLVFISALAAALATVGHGLLGARQVWGLYEPTFMPAPWHLGPLLNSNNLSGYLNLGALCGLGLLLSDALPLPRALVAVGVAAVVGVNVLSASRAGLAVLPLAVLALAVTMEVRRLRKARASTATKNARWLMGGALGLGALLAVLGGTRAIWKELYDENMEKLRMFAWLRPMIGEFRWTGIGRGAFESVSPAFQPDPGNGVYTHAENFVAQWLVEWGIPVGVGALAALAWHFRPKRMGVGRSALAAGAWFGVLAVLLQNLLDLGLETPGVVFGVVVVLGSLWGDRRRALGLPMRQVAPRPRFAAAVALAVLVLGGLGLGHALGRGLHDVASDRVALTRQVVADPAPRSPARLAELRREIRAAMCRHPAEPFFSLLGATIAWQDRAENPMPWLQRTLERSLLNGQAHLLVAQWLVNVPAKRQALLELRLAVESDPALTARTAGFALRWAESFDELLTAVPLREGRAASLEAMAALARDRGVGARCDRMALELEPKHVAPHERLGNDIVTALGSADGCPDRGRCDQEMAGHVAAVTAAEPKRSTGARLEALRLAALGQVDEAERGLAVKCEDFEDYERCLRERAVIGAKIPGTERFAAASKAWLSVACSNPDPCAEAATWIGDLHAGRHEWGAAVNAYKRAVGEGETRERFVKLATAASQTGMHARASRALEQALALGHRSDPELEKRLTQERALALGALAGP